MVFMHRQLTLSLQLFMKPIRQPATIISDIEKQVLNVLCPPRSRHIKHQRYSVCFKCILLFLQNLVTQKNVIQQSELKVCVSHLFFGVSIFVSQWGNTSPAPSSKKRTQQSLFFVSSPKQAMFLGFPSCTDSGAWNDLSGCRYSYIQLMTPLYSESQFINMSILLSHTGLIDFSLL